jgi:hypothetical protein
MSFLRWAALACALLNLPACAADKSTNGPVSSGPVYYFSDCQAGAAPGCVPGDNGNAGTSPSAPKRDLGGIRVNSLPAGSQLLFARGGVWQNFQAAQVANYNVTPERPLVFDAYGKGPAPWMKTGSGGISFNFYEYGVSTMDGGYTVRNLKLDGQGQATAAVAQGWGTTHITLDGVEITGFTYGLLMGDGTRHFTLRNSTVRANQQQGLLGAGTDWTIEGNTFDGNGDARPPGTHSIYFSAGQVVGERLVIRNNTFSNSSLSGGVCRSGNLTVHGRIDGALIEGNTITTPGYGPGCRGVSIAAGYGSAEYMRNFVVRGNRFVNAGGAVAFSAAPGIVVENNLIVDTTGNGVTLIEPVPNGSGGGDDADTGAIVRNNTLYYAKAGNGSVAIRSVAGTKLQVVSNLIYFGAGSHGSHACFGTAASAAYAAFDHNLCHHADGKGMWSAHHASLAAARSAGFDVNGLSSDPLFVAAPSAANGWNDELQPASPAVAKGHPKLSSANDRAAAVRKLPDIGARNLR